MNITKLATKIVAPIISLPGVFEKLSSNLFVTFNYHEISDNPSRFCTDFNLNVRPAIFAQQLIWIKKYFNVISPQQLISGDFQFPAALVTFDDGFKGAFTQGAKLLDVAKVPAVVFMNMAMIQGHFFWSGLVTYLCNYSTQFKQFITLKYGKPMATDFFLYCTNADVSEFFEKYGETGILDVANNYYGELASKQDLISSASGSIYLGNHLFNHFNAVNLSPNDLIEQYLMNESALSEYSNHVPLFSYPFGQPVRCYNQETDKIITTLGAARIFTAYSLLNLDKYAVRLHRVSMFEYVDNEKYFKSHCLVPAFINHLKKWPEARWL